MTRTRFSVLTLFLLVLLAIGVFLHTRMNNAHRNELLTMWSVMNQYTLDKQHAPRFLDELVEAGYLQRTTANDKHVQELFHEAACQ